jgi:hypothetical protein
MMILLDDVHNRSIIFSRGYESRELLQHHETCRPHIIPHSRSISHSNSCTVFVGRFR